MEEEYSFWFLAMIKIKVVFVKSEPLGVEKRNEIKCH